MTSLTVKQNFVYENAGGERIRITRALREIGNPNPIEFYDERGMIYCRDGKTKVTMPDSEQLVKELFECHGLDTEHGIFFYEQDYYIFSNFSSFAIRWRGMLFNTVEHAYHYEKFDTYGLNRDNLEERKRTVQVRGLIRNALSAHDAFQVAQQYKDLRRPDWDDKDVKVRIMFMLLIEKVKQHKYVLDKLLNTHGRCLIENSWRDNYWGWGDNKDGRNVLGQLWMFIRSIAESGQLYAIDPATHSLDYIYAVLPEPVAGEEKSVSNESRSDAAASADTMIKIPLPAGVEDNDRTRARIQELLLELHPNNPEV